MKLSRKRPSTPTPSDHGIPCRQVTPGASFDATFGEFIFPYDAMRTAEEPEAVLLDFLMRRIRPPLRQAIGIARRWNADRAFLGHVRRL